MIVGRDEISVSTHQTTNSQTELSKKAFHILFVHKSPQASIRRQQSFPIPSPSIFHLYSNMLFSRAATRSLFRSFVKRSKATVSEGHATEKASSAATGLVAAVGATFGTYMIADFLSNFIQHPTQKVCSWFTTKRACGGRSSEDDYWRHQS